MTECYNYNSDTSGRQIKNDATGIEYRVGEGNFHEIKSDMKCELKFTVHGLSSYGRGITERLRTCPVEKRGETIPLTRQWMVNLIES